MKIRGKVFRNEQTIFALLAIILAVAALLAISCGGGGGSYSNASPTTPSTTTPPASSTPPSGAVTVSIVGSIGNTAFSPNPVQVPANGSMVWKNNTSDIHHIVMDDGTVVGDIAPGASLTSQLKGAGGKFHCTNHPTMVGSINGASAPPDPAPNSSGGYDY